MRAAWGRSISYYYDLIDRLGKYKEVGSNFEHSVAYTYDGRNNLSKLIETINGAEHVTDYTCDYENRLTGTTTYDTDGEEVVSQTLEYDELGRLDITRIKQDSRTVASFSYLYNSGQTANTATSQLSGEEVLTYSGAMLNNAYEYDANGNITSHSRYICTGISNDPFFGDFGLIEESSYHYDTANQLVRGE